MNLPIVLGLGALLSAATAEPADSLGARLDRIRIMVGEIGRELDSLQKEIAAEPPPAKVPEDSGHAAPGGKEPGPILGELLSPREKALASAAGTPFQRVAVGYSFDPEMPLGMHYLAWGARWGMAAAATTRLSESQRQAGAELILLRGLHRFSLFEGLQTHLYAFAGPGIYWRRVPYDSYYNAIPITIPPTSVPSRDWYGTPNVSLRFRMGAGSELGLINLGGVRGAPEVGFQALRYLSRYQDSEIWAEQYRLNPGFQEKPKSDFSLGFFIAFHLSFYFL